MHNRVWIWTAIVVASLVLGTFTTAQHVRSREPKALVWEQVVRNEAVLNGVAGNPWQYRVLTAYLVEEWRVFLASSFPPSGAAAGRAFVSLRILLDSLIALLSVCYYRRLGLPTPLALIGTVMLAWGMSYAHFDSDFSFNTYLELVFYLTAALLLLSRRYWLLVPLTVLAALNRESGALIPFMGLSLWALDRNTQHNRVLIAASALSAVLFATIFVWLRIHYGAQELISAYGHTPGVSLLRYNISQVVTWEQLLATFSILPLIALAGYRTWPLQLRAFFWAIVPVWILVHSFMALLAETRLLLVPQALVFIPGALFLVRRSVLADAKTAGEIACGELPNDRDLQRGCEYR